MQYIAPGVLDVPAEPGEKIIFLVRPGQYNLDEMWREVRVWMDAEGIPYPHEGGERAE